MSRELRLCCLIFSFEVMRRPGFVTFLFSFFLSFVGICSIYYANRLFSMPKEQPVVNACYFYLTLMHSEKA